MHPYPPLKSLRRLLAEGRHMRFMEAHNALSATIANEAHDPASARQFDGVWASSLTLTAASALPDLEMTVVDNRLDAILEIVEASRKPVIVDGDTGGSTSALRYFCRKLARMGAAAVIVEEKSHIKLNSLDDTAQPLADPIEFAVKLGAAREAIPNHDLMVIARLESLMVRAGMDDALTRADIYARSGVDGVMIHSKHNDASEIAEFSSRFRTLGHRQPIFCVPTTYHVAHAETLFAHGVQGVIYANHQLRAAHHAMKLACASILVNDRSTEIELALSSTKQLFDEVGYTAEVDAIAEIDRRIVAARRDSTAAA